jgi:AcrR family transcriptional regulator
MRMPSQKSTSITNAARIPQRQRGKLRVAALLAAAAAVFGEKGYQSATMTEIAARAKAPVGSLYQFFPSKEALADALLARYGEQVDNALRAIADQVGKLSLPALAEALLTVLIDLREERAVPIALIDERRDSPNQPSELRRLIRQRIAEILILRAPWLARDRADAMAVALHALMKAAMALSMEIGLETWSGALAELCRLARLYLDDGLSRPAEDRRT